MVYATLSSEMLDLLRGMIGNELVSYECAVQNNEIYGNLRINTSGGAVEVVNEVQKLPFFDGCEDISFFRCCEASTDKPNVFAPAGMTHSGFIGDVKDNPQWGLTCDGLDLYGAIEGMAQGCGDIVTTSGDIHLWMTALRSGKVVSMESYREMTTGHSASYGYGLMRASHGGWGHNGSIPGYTSRTYFNKEYGYQLFVVNNKTPLFNSTITEKTGDDLLRTLFEAVDAAQN